MNKDIFNGLSVDEQLIAEKLNLVSENMKVPQNFQWTLESQLMDAYQNKSGATIRSFSKLIVPVAWTLAAVLGFFLLNWTIRSLVPPEQINAGASNTVLPFETQVRQEIICKGPLALAHGFSVSLTNEDKTAFVPLDEETAIGELRSFAWSSDGEQLAILGNTTGNGNIYITDLSDTSLQPVLSNPELGYLFDFAWSRDGEQFVIWALQNNKKIYLLNSDGVGLDEKQLNVQILGTPQFTPDNRSILYYGADSSTAGLFEFTLDGSQTNAISNLVEDDSGFAWSPDGSQLAYFEMDRGLGEARLIAEEFESGDKNTLATLPISKGSGSSIPDVANLNWSQDGKKLVFEFGRNAIDRAVYIAYADGSGLVKLVDSAHAPTISADGNCLAYISNKQVFIADLVDLSLTSSSLKPSLLANLPKSRGTADFRLDKLQWRP